ncbi:MAG: hypothetical protein JWP94_539 [Mucilaginibacter sp.]|nr:hypothetical protein [Mucilaginibacter sp.]
MLIPLHLLIEYYNIDIKGILHVGASEGQEMEVYSRCGIESVYWIEAIEEMYIKLCARLRDYPNAKAYHACITDSDGQEVTFKITNNNGESSSIFNLKKHKKYYPDIVVIKTITMLTTTLDTLIKNEAINIADKVNLLVMDIQGAELLALKGCKKNLKYIEYVYLEVCIDEFYEHGAKVKDIDAYLEYHHFFPVLEKKTNMGWGDRFYMKDFEKASNLTGQSKKQL